MSSLSLDAPGGPCFDQREKSARDWHALWIAQPGRQPGRGRQVPIDFGEPTATSAREQI
jgi:hypothetical protein